MLDLFLFFLILVMDFYLDMTLRKGFYTPFLFLLSSL